MVLPVIALVAGVGALGYWGTVDHAKDMQAEIATNASAAVDGASIHNVRTEISGRDITVTGLAHSAAERDEILARLDEVKGRRAIRDELKILPVAESYAFNATKSEDGLSLSGVLPTTDALETIKGSYASAQGLDGLSLASGEPDMMFGDAANNGMAALGQLTEGDLNITGKTVSLRGLASDTDTLASVQNIDLPAGYTLDADVSVPLPFVELYSFSLSKDTNGTISGKGYAPNEATAAAIKATVGGDLDIELADGAPDLDWAELIGAGNSALGQMDQGEMTVRGNMLDVTGMAPEGQSETITAMLAEAMPVGAQLSTTIAEPQPALPPKTALNVFVDANEEITVYGDGPEALSDQAMRDALGLPATAKIDVNGVDTQAGPALAELQAIKDWLPEFETALFEVSGKGISLEGETKSDVDATLLEQVLSTDDRFSGIVVRPTQREYENGFKRLDLVNGDMMEHISGYWIPVATFAVSAENCTTNLDGLIQRQSVTYLRGDATLSPKARRAVNALAGLLRRCLVDDSLYVQIDGHTDSVGNDAYNLDLSRARSASVVSALTARGIGADLMSSAGYGESKPIASNETVEGRAMNRRTEITLVRR